jgi:hypothetical protein
MKLCSNACQISYTNATKTVSTKVKNTKMKENSTSDTDDVTAST